MILWQLNEIIKIFIKNRFFNDNRTFLFWQMDMLLYYKSCSIYLLFICFHYHTYFTIHSIAKSWWVLSIKDFWYCLLSRIRHLPLERKSTIANIVLICYVNRWSSPFTGQRQILHQLVIGSNIYTPCSCSRGK